VIKDRRTPWIENLGIALFAFRANNAGMMLVSLDNPYVRAADVAEIVEVEKIVGCYLDETRKRFRGEK
jgi:hypothetical protein